MSRTMTGYAFKCKKCLHRHILVNSEPHDGIFVWCALDEKASGYYKKDDFTLYHGFRDPFIEVEEVDSFVPEFKPY